MSKHILRAENNCLNCGKIVNNRFCPSCGQENIETRKSFYDLFVHFFEDLTHYENAFWRTIKNLLFKPASLTKEYLSGKRMSYLAPVRLYIFISFITFLIVPIFNKSNSQEDKKVVKYGSVTITIKDNDLKNTEIQKRLKILNDELDVLEKSGITNSMKYDSLQSESKNLNQILKAENDWPIEMDGHKIKSQFQLDSIQKTSPENVRFGKLSYSFVSKILKIKNANTNEEIIDKTLTAMKHNFPKALFVYMPIFAFVLWLFHDKRKWYYFDHGIFTLHYFSFLLLTTLLLFFVNSILGWFHFGFLDTIAKIISFLSVLWVLYYFFPAHHRFYGNSRIKTAVIGSVLFIINLIMMSVVLSGFVIYSFLTIK